MQLFNIIFERLPMVWFLLGLLFNSLALYLGLDNSLFFVYLIVGWGCCAYGLAIFFLQKLERPKQSQATKLSPNFISAGDTAGMPSPAANQEAQETADQESHDQEPAVRAEGAQRGFRKIATYRIVDDIEGPAVKGCFQLVTPVCF